MTIFLEIFFKSCSAVKAAALPSSSSFGAQMFAFAVMLLASHESHKPRTAAHATVATHALWFQNNVKITDTCPSPLPQAKPSACSVAFQF